MKRLALLLGSLLVVSAAASAKEVVPAPVVVEETPVKVVEKEVIVYRDRAPEWRPNGYVDLSQDYYGKTENQKRALDNGRVWNGDNKYTRTVLEGELALTENQKMDFRTRWYQSVDHKADNGKSNDLRLRYYYNHGELMGVPATTRLAYENDGSANSLEYRMEFDFAKYFFNNDYVKTTAAVIAPTYKYSWAHQTSGNGIADTAYANTLGLYANFENQLPYGFGFQLEFDGLNFNKVHDEGGIGYWNGNSWQSKDKDFVATVNAKLTHAWNLYSEGDVSVDWAFEGGYDSYVISNLREYANTNDRGERAKYSLMAKPEVAVSYAATKFVNLYAKVGAEYRNWQVEAQSEASHWRWQPYATVGVKTTF